MTARLLTHRFLITLASLALLLTGLPVDAARLIPDKAEIEVGETVFVKRDAGAALFVKWSASPELEVLNSSDKGATVKGVKAGKAELIVKYLGGKESIRITVHEAAVTSKVPAATVALAVIASPAEPAATMPRPSSPSPTLAPAAGDNVLFMAQGPIGSYDDFATRLLAKVRSGVNPTDRELLMLMTQPGSVNALTNQWRAAGAGAAIERALALRRTIFQRALDRLAVNPSDDIMAVIALGSWAESLNPGDMDVLMRASPRMAKEFNELMGEEITRIFGQESDDLVRQFIGEGRTFTVETFEIFVSTFEDFGNLQFANLALKAKDMAAKGNVDGALALIREQADDIITKSLRAQSWAAAHAEYYPGVAGQDFVRKYFNTPGKSRVWFKSPSGSMTEASGGLTVNQIAPEILEKMGLSLGQVSKPSYQFPVIADEYALWLKRGQLGAREQAKGLARAYDSGPGWEVFQQLSEEEQNAFRCARIIQNVDREDVELINYWLREFGFGDPTRFAQAGEEALWKLLRFSNDHSLQSIENAVSEGMTKAAAARAGNKTALMEAELLRIKDYLASHEQLAALSKLDEMTLFNLGQSLPNNLAFREEWKALYELMAQGMEQSADDAFLMARRLLQIAVSQGRLSPEVGLSSIQALRRGQALSPEVEQVVAVVRRELSELAAIRGMTPAVETLADCQGILRMWSKNPNSLTLSDEVAELVGELARLSDVTLLRLGFKDSEIGLLRQLHQARLAGRNTALIGARLKQASPSHWKSSLRAMVAIGGTISIISTINTLSDPSIPEDQIEKVIAESVYSVFPTVGLALEGLPLAADALIQGYEVDGKALATGVTLSVLEIVGLSGPVGAAVAAVPLIAYGTYAGLTYINDTEQDRRFVGALYAAVKDKDTLTTLKVIGNDTRSFETRGLAIVPNVGNKNIDVIHTPAFVDLYTPRGDVVLDAPYRKFTTPIRTALREYAKRNVWANNKDLPIWETAVRRYFPDIDLDKVESWNLSEVSEQARSVDGKPFKVGAHLVRRYVNTRNMLTESTINQLKTRVADMINTVRSTDEWRNKLETIEVDLSMEKRIVPNAEAEVESFLEWLKTAALSNATRIEQVGAIWKRYLKTYGEAKTQYQRWLKVHEDVGLSLQPAGELFGLSGKEAEDKDKIDKVYVAFQNAYGKAGSEFRTAKGGAYDENVEFDRDAWKRLLSLRLRLFQDEFFKTTAARRAQLEQEIEAVLEEIRAHYAGNPVAELYLSPSELIEGDSFNASIRITQGKVPKGASWTWQGSGGVTVQGSGESARGVAITSGQVHARLTSTEGKILADLSAEVIVKPKPKDDGQKPPGDDSGGGSGNDDGTGGGSGQSGPTGDGKITFGANASDNWDMAATEKGVKFTRKVAKMKGPCGWDSSVSATVTATFRGGAMDDKALQKAIAETRADLDKQKAERKIGCASPDMAVGLFKAGGLDAVGGISLGEFQGGIVDYPNWVRRGSGGWMTGYTGSSMVACGNGAVHAKPGTIEFSYSAYGGGCWDNSDRAYLVRQVLAAQKEARSLIASLRPSGDGLKQSPYKGPKYDGSDNPTVKLLPEKMARLKVGDLATIEAVVENAEPEDPPYTYDWDGTFHGKAEDLKKSATATLNPEKPGKYKVGVSVTGQRFGMGYASLEYEVADVKVSVERVPAGNAPVPVGGKAKFKAVLTIDGKPASGNYIYRWQPNTELKFSATESAKAIETTATFTQLGKQKLWVEVLERKGATESTVVESDRLEVEVIEPKLSLSAEPKEPLVGQETRVTLKDEPRLDDKMAGFRWEHKGDAINPGPAGDERVFTFKPKNIKPVTVRARGYLRDDNTDLGEAEIILQPKAYDVKLGAPQARGPRPQVWKCDTQLGGAAGCGMVDLPQGQFVTFQDITIPSTITPRPDSPRYRWTIDPSGSCGLPASSSELRLNCSNTGSYTVRLEVTDADGVQLGSAETSVSVSTSQDKINADKNKAQATQKLNEAKQLWNQGKYDEAVSAAESAAQADKSLATPTLNQFSQGLKQQGWDALHKGERDTAIKKLEQSARLNPNDTDAQKKLADARDHVAKWPQVETKVRQFDDHIANKRIWSAQRTMLEMQDILRTMAAGQSSDNPTWKRVMDDFNAGLQDYNRFTQEKSARHTQYFKEENYPEMLRNAESMRERELSPADEKECQSRIDFAKRYLKAAEFGRQASDLTRQGRYEDALQAIEQGRAIDYKQVKAAAEELSTTVKRLGKEAEQRRDFATSGKYYALALKVNPQDGEAIGGNTNAQTFQKYLDLLHQYQREVENHISNGDWDKAEDRLHDVKLFDESLPGGLSEESKALFKRHAEGYAAYQAWVEPIKLEVGRYLQYRCLDKAQAKIMEMRAKHLIWMDQDWTRVFLDSIAESKRTCSSGNVPLTNNCGSDCSLDEVDGSKMLPGQSYSCLAKESGSTKSWACTIKFSATSGNVTGELSWPTLGSVHRISGAWTSDTLNFKEVSAIQAGRAHLNVSYTLTRTGNKLTGQYSDPADRSTGTFTVELGERGIDQPDDGSGETKGHPVNTLGSVWDKLSAVGGNFDRFARFDNSGLKIDVPAGNGWGKTGLMAKQPMFKIGKKPISVTVQVDPTATTGFAVAFAASQHPDVALINNAWMSWVRNAKGGGDIWLGNIQDAWSGRNKGVSEPTSGSAPASFAYTLEPGRITVQPAGYAPLSVEIEWLKEGVSIYPHVFTHPTESGKASSLRLVGFQVAAGSSAGPIGSDVVTGMASLTLDKSTFEPGAQVIARWSAPSSEPDNTWVGLIPSGVAHGATSVNDQHDMVYKYVGKERTGTMTFTAPNKEGRYDLRMSSPASGKELVSVTFTVQVNAQAGGLTLPKTVYAPNEQVVVSFTASAGYPKNTWVGLIPSGVAHGSTAVNDQHDMAYKYLEGKTGGSLEFSAPNKVDSYDLRMNETSNDKEVATVSFKVTVPVEGAQLWLPKAAFKPGEVIRLRFQASALLPKNAWVGLIPSAVAHGATSVNDQHDVAYRYIEGKASGEMVFNAPAKEGGWDLRLNETTNNTEVISISFSVNKNAPSSGSPVSKTNPGSNQSGPTGSGGSAIGTGSGTSVGSQSPAASDEFENPQVDGTALDYCREWAGNCGKPAADAWCQSKGYSQAIDYRVKNDTPPTRIVTSKQLCNDSGCDRIVWVRCAGGAGTTAQPGTGNSVAGGWTLDANGWAGVLELSNGCTMLKIERGWETLTEFNTSGNTVRFTRPLSGYTQRYTGTVSGSSIQGTFTQEGTGTVYKWSAKRASTPSGAPCAGASNQGGREYTSTVSTLKLTPDKTSYAAGESIILHYSGIANPAAQDWIAVFAAGAKNEQYGEWYYLKGSASGNLQFKAPSVPGSYEFRLFLNWPTGGYTDVVRSPAIQVAAKAAAISGVGAATVAGAKQEVAQTPPSQSPFLPVDLSGVGGKRSSPRIVKQIPIDDGSWIRFKSSDEKRLFLDIPLTAPFQTAALALVSNLDDATYLDQGKTIARLTVIKDSGNESFEIKAGIHASEWNYRAVNPKHAWFEQGFIGGDRFMAILALSRPGLVQGLRIDYVETGAPRWAGHAPGFCLRGVTLSRDPMAANASAGASPTPVSTSGVPTPGKPDVSYDNGNIGGVGNGPTQPTTFTLNESRILALIQDYHWNYGRGATPGSIGLRDASGQNYGPWGTSGSPGQGGVPNAYWTARPMVVLPAGTYTVTDSDPASWAQNSQSGGRGFTRVETLPVGSGGRAYTSQPSSSSTYSAPGNLPSTQKGTTLFELGNAGGVQNKPDKGSKFDLDEPHVISLIQNYHWNNGRGATPGTISLNCRNKQSYGPWQAIGSPGQGGVPNAYWTVYPNVIIPATTCAVVDSDPATWSHNSGSGYRGFTRVEGYPASAGKSVAVQSKPAQSQPPNSTTDKVDDAIQKVDDTLNKINKFLDIFK